MRTKQQNLWLLAVMAAPLAHFSDSGWLMTVVTAAATLPLTVIPKEWSNMGKFLALLEIVWLGIVAGSLLANTASYWPSDNDLVVPLTILALAAITKENAAPRIGAVLAFCMALLAIPAAVAAMAKMKMDWLSPVTGKLPWAIAWVLLLPNLPVEGEAGRRRGIRYIGILAVALSVVVQGTISTVVAASVHDPFYQTARTLGYMEPLIAAGVTLGWYTLAAYLLSSARYTAKENKIGEVWPCVLVVGTATASVLLEVQLQHTKMALFGVLFWVLIPFCTKIKNFEKR